MVENEVYLRISRSAQNDGPLPPARKVHLGNEERLSMESSTRHLNKEALEAGIAEIRRSPKNDGLVEMISRRPQTGLREILCEGVLDPTEGLVGDNWKRRHEPDVAMQLTVMNARAIALIAQDKNRWALAGDQLFVDLDLSEENLPAGTRLSIGPAIIEVSEEPHNGCKKFVERFGMNAMQFVNSPLGKQLHLRGVNARIIKGGTIRVGDAVKKL